MPDENLTFEFLHWAVIVSAVLIAAFTDIRTQLIPNWLTFPLILSGFCAAVVVGGWGTSGFLNALGGSALLGAPYILVYARGGGGAGDAKLLLGIGAWSGIELGIYFMAGVFVCSLLFFFAFSLARRELKAVLYSTFIEAYRLLRMQSSMSTIGAHSGEVEGATEQEEKTDSVIVFGPIIAAGVLVGGVAWFLT